MVDRLSQAEEVTRPPIQVETNDAALPNTTHLVPERVLPPQFQKCVLARNVLESLALQEEAQGQQQQQ